MKKLATEPRRRVRPRIPIAYASLLVIALVAVVGFAAFSPSSGSSDAASTTIAADNLSVSSPMSARVAAAVLGIRVADPSTRTATTQTDEVGAVETQTVETQTTEAQAVTDDASQDDAPQTSTTAPDDVSVAVDETAPAPTAALQSAPADTSPPSFKITSPHDGDTIGSKIVEIKGTVEKGASVRSGPFDAKVNDDGTWSISLALAEGANGASLTATDAAGNASSLRIVLHYVPPVTKSTPTTTKAPTTKSTPTTTHATTTTKASSPTTTKAPSTTTSSKWSPNWPADAGGIRDVEQWRSTVAKHWPANRVDCVLGIIYRESKGNPRAYNSTYGASGLMQHLAKYWESRAAGAGFKDSNGLVASPYNGEANIAAGAYLARYYEGRGSNWYVPWNRLTSYGSCSG